MNQTLGRTKVLFEVSVIKALVCTMVSCVLHQALRRTEVRLNDTVASREIETTGFDPASQFLSNISRRA